MNKKLLLVEDEPGLILTLTDRLENEGFEIDVATDGEIGFQKAQKNSYQLILLDIMLPKKTGLDVCRDLRSLKVQTPILMLTAKGQVIDKVLGLKMGADDYLSKPFDFMELTARIEALVRRSEFSETKHIPKGIFQFDDVLVNETSGEVTKSGKAIYLSAKEFHLLVFMIQPITEKNVVTLEKLSL